MSGISRWQCGHQWAAKMTIWTEPVGSMATGAPWWSWPWTTGAAIPTAGSSVVLVNVGSGVPVMTGGPASTTPDDPAADGAGDGGPELTLAEEPASPPTPSSTRARRRQEPARGGAGGSRIAAGGMACARVGLVISGPFVGGMVEGSARRRRARRTRATHGQQREDGQERDEGERRQADEAEDAEPDDRA
jgi:hypothetical protein